MSGFVSVVVFARYGRQVEMLVELNDVDLMSMHKDVCIYVCMYLSIYLCIYINEVSILKWPFKCKKKEKEN